MKTKLLLLFATLLYPLFIFAATRTITISPFPYEASINRISEDGDINLEIGPDPYNFVWSSTFPDLNNERLNCVLIPPDTSATLKNKLFPLATGNSVNIRSTDPIPAKATMPSGSTFVCAGSNVSYTTTSCADATYYEWRVTPTSGTLKTCPGGESASCHEFFTTTTTLSTTVFWNSAYNGSAKLKVRGLNSSQTGEWSDSLSIIINPLPTIYNNTIDGTSNVCLGSSATFNVFGINATSYDWTLPGTWIGSSSTSAITCTVGPSNGTISVTAINACGNSTPATLAVNSLTIPANAGTINGTDPVCQGGTGTYSLSPVSGATSYIWTIPSGATGSSSFYSIGVTLGAQGGSISVTPANICGNGGSSSKTITVNPLPITPTDISGFATVCSGTLSTYSTSAAYATSYTWIVPGGWSGTSTSSSISCAVGTIGGNISVYAKNSCGNSDIISKPITVNPLPDTPDPISGLITVCSGTPVTYTSNSNNAASYTWTLPPGWSGSGSSSTITTTIGPNSGTISVVANNTCGTSAAASLAITVNSIPAPTGPIDGSDPVCQGSTQTFSITPVSGASNYTWTLPSGWAGTSNTNSITTTIGNLGGTISVQANSSCGSNTVVTKTVTVNSLPGIPSAISGFASVCPGTLVSYSSSAANATSYAWTLPSGWSGSSTSGSIAIATGSSDGTLSVIAKNTCGNSTSASRTITLNPLPGSIGIISGFDQVCTGSTLLFGITPVSNATNYSWTLPNGWSGSSSTTQITATVGTSGNQVSVIASNTCGSTIASTKAITLLKVPGQPGIINGNDAVCSNTSQIYNITPVSEATNYAWSLPNTWNGVSTSSSMTTTVGTTGGMISVKALNTCGYGPSATKSITVKTVPGSPSLLTGNVSQICEGSTQTYSINSMADAMGYTWTFPSGWTGTSSTTSITTTVGPSGGSIKTAAINSCGNSPELVTTVTVIAKPTAIPSLTGTTSVMAGTNQTYTVSGSPNPAITYIWTLPTGWTGTSNSNSISTIVGTALGNFVISAAGQNTCGTGPASSLAIEVTRNVGISPGPDGQDVTYWPNPVVDQLFINGIPLNSYIEVYDLMGKQKFMLPRTTETLVKISFESFPAGLYFVKISTPNYGSGTYKITK